jgi:hypothetical protein
MPGLGPLHRAKPRRSLAAGRKPLSNSPKQNSHVNSRGKAGVHKWNEDAPTSRNNFALAFFLHSLVLISSLKFSLCGSVPLSGQSLMHYILAP